MKRIEDLIRKESLSAEQCEKALGVLHELLNKESSLVGIDADDLVKIFEPGKELIGMDLSVPGVAEDRIDQMKALIKDELAANGKKDAIALLFLDTESKELTMEELGDLTSVFDDVESEPDIIWGVSKSHDENLHIVMLCQ